MITRFAPSPTGNLHLGNIRTALYSFLWAKSLGGKFLLRIEDTDCKRLKVKGVENILKDLNWLGIIPDLGFTSIEKVDYLQSKRGSYYDNYLKKLEDLDLLYPCFCTDEELKEERKILLKKGKTPKYSQKCLRLTKSQIEEYKNQKVKYSLRYKVQENKKIEFNDCIKGDIKFNSSTISDFIIKKSDGKCTFTFVNTVDDYLMGISHVLRGEDHLTNTARQILISNDLNFNNIKYAHIGLMTLKDTPLSKRDNSIDIGTLKSKKYYPLAIINYLARIGNSSYDKDFSLSYLINNFKNK